MKLRRCTAPRLRKFSRLFLALLILGLVSTGSASNPPTSDPSAITWAAQAVTTLTGGVQINDVSLQANVTRSIGGNQQTGTMTIQSSGVSNSQITVTFGSNTISESRGFGANGPTGQWTDASGNIHQMAQHNCFTDAAWFFPAFSMLADNADPNLIFTDLGQEQHRGVTVEHLRVYYAPIGVPPAPARTLALMSITDYYLDSQSALPVAIAFFAHSDNDSGTSIPVEIVFSGYQRVSQALVPYQITKYHNHTQLFQISVSSAQVQ